MLSITSHGNFDNLEKSLDKMKKSYYSFSYGKYGRRGVSALSSATPVDSGTTADSWGYTVESDDDHITVQWTNDNIVDDYYSVALGLQYGHATGTGGYVPGQDYINPAIGPVMDDLADDVWREVFE